MLMRKSLLFLIIVLLSGIDLYAQAEFNTGTMIVSINQYGRIRLFTTDDTRHLQRASILVGTAPTHVFDYQNDAEELEPTVLVTNPALSNFEIYGAYDNSYSGDPPAVIVKLNAYGWTNGAYTLVKFKVINDEASAISASVGLDIIAELNQEYGFDTVTYLNNSGVIRFHRGNVQNMGMKLLGASLSSLYSFEWYDGYEVDADYWNWMNYGSLQPQYVSTTLDGPVTVTAQDPVTLAPGQSMDVFYAMALGSNQTQMLANIAACEAKFNSLFTAVNETPSFRDGVKLTNQPNPCNHQTTISYQLTEEGLVSLKVYDVLGNEVTSLVNENQNKGIHKISFNTESLPEGIYFYTLQTGNNQITRKMVINR